MPKRLCLCLLILTVSCSGNIPIPRIVFDTPMPTGTALPTVPTVTPLPTGGVILTVHIPSNTPPGSVPIIKILDEVGGTSTFVDLVSAGNNTWTGNLQATLGSVLRYKYIRRLPTVVEEVTPARQPIPYRLLAISSVAANVEDTVAAWADTPFAGDLGGLAGTVRNSNSGQGVPGMIVSAGGKLAVTAADGSYALFDLPVGVQRATLLAPDGSLRPAQNSIAVVKGQTLPLDLASTDPNQVNVTFLVSRPAGMENTIPLRLVGNVLQLGDTFISGAGGSAIAAAREPTLTPLNDGRWTTTVLLYEGTVLNYAYTLGDGLWNGELDVQGAKRLRQMIVPLSNVTVEDAIDAWRGGNFSQVTFEVTTPANTPANDVITIQFRTTQWHAPVPMWRVGLNAWKFVLYNPTDIQGNVFYRYCRNFACGTADDAATAGNAVGRVFTPTLLAQDLKDTVHSWAWLAEAAATPTILPAINLRPNFVAGIDFGDEWHPNQLPFYAETLTNIHNEGANWVTFTRLGINLRMNPAPAYAEDLALAPLPIEWNLLVSQAHTYGLRVALHPVTCHYTPYGICDYWNNAPYSPDFWNAWFAAYEKYILSEADLAARSGTDLLVIGDFKLRPSFPGEPEAPADAEARWRNLIKNIRAHYSGPLAFELLMGQGVWPAPPKFLDAVEVIRFFWWGMLTTTTTPNVNDLMTTAGNLLDTHLLPIQQQFQKPIQISAAYYAADGAATQCLKRENGECYSYEDFNPNARDVSRFSLDLQEQADIFSGLLNAVNTRAWVSGFSVFGYNPQVALRDKSISVRGKPAEAVLAAWYPRLK